MSVNKDINELLKAEVISQQTADRIIDYYKKRKKMSYNRLPLIFGVIGAVLTGLGVILLFAHNWDKISISVKTALAFIPLIFSQILCAYVIMKKYENDTFRELASIFLFFSVGISLSLISQIYNISGNGSKLIYIWLFLSFPVFYIMRSAFVSLLYLLGLTFFVFYANILQYCSVSFWIYLILLALFLPYYIHLYVKKNCSHFTLWDEWLIPINIIIGFFVFFAENLKYDEYLVILYISLFSLFSIIGNWLENKFKRRFCGYSFFGAAGLILILFWLSFSNQYWNEVNSNSLMTGNALLSINFIAAFIVFAVTLTVLVIKVFKRYNIDIFEVIFIIFIPVFVLGIFYNISFILVNMLILLVAVIKIVKGVKLDRIGELNFGLIVISALIICRFFDVEISFLLRGVVFIILGIGFFYSNYSMIRRSKK